MPELRLTTGLVTGLFVPVVLWFGTACGLLSPPLENVDLSLPRSDVRDAVREGATLGNGEPLFAQIENDYGFVDDHFHLDGVANTNDGTTYDASMDLTFAIEDGVLRFEIVNHNLQLDAATLERLSDDISAEFMRSIADSTGREIHQYDAVTINENVLVVTMRVEPIPGVIPLNP